MKRLVLLLGLAIVAALPVKAGGFSGGGHVGGSFGSSGGYHGYSGSSYGGHCYYGGYTGYHRYYYGGIYGAYPYYGYGSYFGGSYDYAPVYDSYPVDDSSPAVYTTTSTTPVYPYAPPAPPPASPNPAPATPSSATPTGVLTAGPSATGKLDDFGFIHSPYSNATFKSDKIAPGQVFYDPITGQPFTVAKPEPAPSAPAPVPTTMLPAGKLDEFGYVHSPFSTFTFKVPNGNYAQVFRDPFTGQSFVVRPKESPPAVAGTVGSAQASD